MTPLPFKRITFSPHWPFLPLEETLRRVRQVEDAGFEGIWASEGNAAIDPFIVLALYAQATRTLQLGTAIVSWTRTPPTMASSAATLDAVSGGRFRLGLGTMPRDWNERWHNIDFSRPVRRMREYVELLRLLWASHSGKSFSYEGEVFQVRQYARRLKPVRDRVPIYLAVTMPQMTRLAGEVADGVILHNIHTLPYLRAVTLPALAEGAARTGRTLEQIDISPSILCSISDDRAEAIHWAKTHVVSHLIHPYVHAMFAFHGLEAERDTAVARLKAGDVAGAVDAMPDEVAQLVTLAGTPDDCRRKLAEYTDFANVPRLTSVSQHVPADFVAENHLRIIETFASR